MTKIDWKSRIGAMLDAIGICTVIYCAIVVSYSFSNFLSLSASAETPPAIEILEPAEPVEQLVCFSPEIPVIVTKAHYDAINNDLAALSYEVEVLSKILYREARGMDDVSHIAAVAWCVLNRVDNPRFADNILDVVWAEDQFCWIEDTPLTDSCNFFAEDVITRWLLEKYKYTDVGRVLPREYLYFYRGSDGLNCFTATWRGDEIWDWSLPSPYNN